MGDENGQQQAAEKDSNKWDPQQTRTRENLFALAPSAVGAVFSNTLKNGAYDILYLVWLIFLKLRNVFSLGLLPFNGNVNKSNAF